MAIFSAKTLEDLKERSDKRGAATVSELRGEELKCSASNWTERHLIAYRLLPQPEKEILRTFKSDHDNQCPVCKPGSTCPQQLNRQNLEVLVRKPCPLNLFRSSETELMELPHGHFWVALARAARPDVSDNTARPRSERDTKPVLKPDYVDSTTAILCSSSPTNPSSSNELPSDPPSSSFEVDAEDVDEDQYDARRSMPEETTVRFVTEFLQHSLLFCLRQNTKRSEVRVRVEHKRSAAHLSQEYQVISEDDGGIWKMYQQENSEWTIESPFLALLEAKRAFKRVDVDKTGRIQPVMSNEVMAQCFGEALITWEANQDDFDQDVFVIAAANTFVRFMHFHFGSDYAEYIEAAKSGDAERQTELINDRSKDTCVRMRSCKWANLQTCEGRRVALCHVLALLRWHDAQEDQDQAQDSSQDEAQDKAQGDSDDSDYIC